MSDRVVIVIGTALHTLALHRRAFAPLLASAVALVALLTIAASAAP